MAVLSKKTMNFSYGMGAAVVIVGALFKITHLELGPITGNFMLTIGLLVEAAIFALSAFEPVEDEYKWENVYPQLLDKSHKKAKVAVVSNSNDGAEGQLSKKLDALLKEAKIDGELMSSLSSSIRGFESAAKAIVPTPETLASTHKYSEELSLAAAHMESLNSLYKVQLQSAARNEQINEEILENNIKLKNQMHSLTTNLTTLNSVYGGMLSAMNNKG